MCLRLALFLMLSAWACQAEAGPQRTAIDSGITVPLAAVGDIALSPGAVGTMPLASPATRVVVFDGTVASAHVATDRTVVIAARGPGRTRIVVRDGAGHLVRDAELVVAPPARDITGALPPNAGPSFPRTPTAKDFAHLMGPHWMRPVRLAAASLMPAANRPPETGARTRPPLGWHQFCHFYASECAVPDDAPRLASLTIVAWRQLQAVNRAVNRRIRPESDMDHHGTIEHWDYPMDGAGDCEDYALLKRRLLLDAGWPRQALLMTVVRDRQGEGHAVLTVTTDRGDFILDNEVADILPWEATGYRYVKRQSATSPNDWLSLNGIDTAVPTVAAAGSRTDR